jgi:hypothetical protein
MADEPVPALIHQSEESYGVSFKRDLFEQYKLYVSSAERTSDRRAAANNYLLTVNASLVTLYGLVAADRGNGYWMILVPAAGIIVSVAWFFIVASYRNLNSVKFAVIHELERHMPAAIYQYEWYMAGNGRMKTYRPLSHIEGWIPIVFAALHAAIGITSLVSRCHGCTR